MLETRFTQLVGCTVPIQLASMGPDVNTPGLATAVAAAGGVGMLSALGLTPTLLGASLETLPEDSPGVFGVNFLMPFLDRECVPVAARRCRLVEFFYGDPDEALIEQVHEHGALASWQVGSVAEAEAAQRAGCDFVIVQGTEAGGHVRGEVSLLPLLAQVLEALDIPVLAAGGIATGGALAAVLEAGADGARVGTRFLAATESGAHPAYVSAVVDASAGDTCLTEAFSVWWPDAPHRVLRSSIAAAEAIDDDIVGEMRAGDVTIPVPRWSIHCPGVGTKGRVDAMALYAGESVADVHGIQPAEQIVDELVTDALRILDRDRL